MVVLVLFTMRRYLFLVLALSLQASAVQAKPAYKKSLADHYGPLLVRSLDQCTTCHAPEKGTEPKFNTSLENPHNAFGARLMAVAAELVKKRKPTDILTRLDAVASEDTDKDGTPNLAELLTGHQPGSAKDRPSPAELVALPKLKGELAHFRTAYPWKPFESVRRPAVPKVKNAAWVRNPVDAFVAAEQEARGLRPRPEAPREVLLRRVYLDLIGLPPTREEQSAFLADRSPDAYEKVVDRLLASPRYGERWGRHWMDVWRYSDWDGYGQEVRNSQRHIWRWRDWIIDSLNADKGYDRMVQEMLAGDELAPDDPQVLPATGFLVRNWYVFSRHETLTKMVEGTSKAFLGMTVNCARCHDHKFDPISQQEYFNFRAFFEPYDVRTDRLPGQPDLAKDGLPRIFDANPKAETFLLIRGDDRNPDKSRPILPGVPAAFSGASLKIDPVPVPLLARVPDKRPFVVQESVAAAAEAVSAAQRKLGEAQQSLSALEAAASAGSAESQKALAAAREKVQFAELTEDAALTKQAALKAVLRAEQLEDAGKKDTPEWKDAATAALTTQRSAALAEAKLNRLTADRELRAAEAEVQKAANPKTTAAVVAAKKKLVEADAALAKAQQAAALPPGTAYTPRPVKAYPEISTGRRLALARWITDRKNPLAARVAVNHVWLRHFGRALVPSVTDFGVNGQRPANPALVDWLASELMSGEWKGKRREAIPLSPLSSTLSTSAQPWSMKHLHRLLVTSSTYRMDSVYDAASAKIDPENRYLWRANTRRMEAEAVRDSVLYVSGQLDVTAGGPDLDPNIGLTNKRRSLYFRHSMEKQVEFLNTFDQVPPAECYERPETVMPQQALALSNSALSVAQARVLAAELWKQVADRPAAQANRDFVSAAFQQVLSRPPSAIERTECERFLAEQAGLLADPKKLTPFTTGVPGAVPPSKEAAQRARESLVHVLFNHNDFVTIR